MPSPAIPETPSSARVTSSADGKGIQAVSLVALSVRIASWATHGTPTAATTTPREEAVRKELGRAAGR